MIKFIPICFLAVSTGALLNAEEDKTNSQLIDLLSNNRERLTEQSATILELETLNKRLVNSNLDLLKEVSTSNARIRDLEAKITKLEDQIETLSKPSTSISNPMQLIEQAALRSNKDSTGLININNASEAELASLQFIDIDLARRIISNRPYMRIEDLTINRGFGALKLSQIEDLITVGKLGERRNYLEDNPDQNE